MLIPTNISAQFTKAGQNGTDEKNVVTTGETLRIEKVTPINMFGVNRIAPEVVDPQSIYSNVTTSTGQLGMNGGAAVVGGNTITRLVADDLQPTIATPYAITGFRFHVANFNNVVVSARGRFRFYNSDGTGGGPGSFLGGKITAISLPPFTVGTYSSGTLANPINVPSGTFIWVGITFDNNSGATGATAAQLNNLGQGIFSPVDRGISLDRLFRTTAAGDFLVNNPAGAIENSPFGANPVANFGWELLANAPTAASASVSGRVLSGFDSRRGVANATIKMTDAAGVMRFARTNAFGYFQMADVATGQTYLFNVSSKRYQFQTQVVNVNNELTDLNFTPLYQKTVSK